MVDFPDPEGPTMAVQVPAVMRKEILERILTCGCLVYVSERSVNWMGRGVARRLEPCVS